MIPATVTRVMQRRRDPRTVATPALVSPTRETLRLGCVICGSKKHDRVRCSMAIVDEKSGEAR